MDVSIRPGGRLADGSAVDRIELTAGEVAVTVLSYGGIIASVRVPDARGEVSDVVLGFDELGGWCEDPQYFGAIVGRFANRIRDGRFVLDDRPIELAANRGAHHLHGGMRGFDKAVWSFEPRSSTDRVGVVLRHRSPDGDEGYPGALDVEVGYSLDPSGALTLSYRASVDAPTVVNLTNHTYFNLGGGGTVHDHIVTIHGSAYLPIDGDTLPTGEQRPVVGTPFDFLSPHSIGDRLETEDEQLGHAGGYDHCWIIDGRPGDLRPCATVTAAGRRLDVATTQPGVQFYSGNGIRSRIGRGGHHLGPHSGFCLETQHFPDSPNQPGFPSTRLDPADTFEEVTVYRFGSL